MRGVECLLGEGSEEGSAKGEVVELEGSDGLDG